jgi:hypothetical protein
MFVMIKILKWKEYNPRTDVRKPSWFRLENRMIEDQDFDALTHEEFKAWIYVLSVASQNNSDTATIVFSRAERVCQISRSGFVGLIEKLLRLPSPPVDVTWPSRERDADVTPAYATYVRTGQDGTVRDGTYTPDSARSAAPAQQPIIPEFQDQGADQWFQKIKPEVQSAWLAAYPDPQWVAQTLLVAAAWMAANGRTKKNLARFFGNWMAKDWDRRRGPGPSAPPGGFNQGHAARVQATALDQLKRIEEGTL